jgi:PAS domain S-box-containing protein
MEKTLNPVLDALPGMVWTALPDGRIDFLSQQWSEYTGLDVDEGLGTSWQAAIHAEDLPDLLERWRSALLARDASTMEARLRRFDGEYRWFAFHIRPSVDASGKIFKWCGINIDIEDRRRSNEVLRTSESYYRSIVDGIPALVTFVTPAGEVESVNRYVLEFFRTTLEELKNWKNSDIVHPSDLPAYLEAWKAGAETGEPYDVEHRIRCADGIYRWFHARKLPLKNSEGRVIRWYCMLTDIDDRKRAQALLAGEKQFLEMVAGGHSLPEILEELCLLVESITSESYCSVVLVDPSGTRLEHGAAPSLPVSFIRSIIGRPVNVDSGPCAMAAHLNEQVIAADLATETRWIAHSWPQMAMAHGLRACWSTPILSATGKALGAFAIYYNEPKAPSPQHLSLIERFSHIASIAIERIQNDTALKSSEARKTAILDSAIDCIVTIDHEGRITEFNPAAEHTFGYRRGEVLGRELADVIVPPSLREMHRQGVARCRATGEAQMLLGRRAEMTAVRADGSEFPVELAISRIPLDGPPSFTGYLRDITERKQAEEKLRRSEASLAEAQHLSSTGSFFWNFETGEFTWSEQLYRMFELEQGVPINFQVLRSRYHPEDLALLNDKIDQARRAVGDFDYEHRILMSDLSTKYLHVVAHGSRNKDGQLEYVGAVQDVTERRSAEAALSKARSELAHVARITSLGVLTASIAHEVNQPLSGIITNASTCLRMLAADPPNLDGARETARRMIRDGNRASDVITRLRALFGRKSPTNEPLELNKAVHEVIALLRGELQAGRINLRLELGDSISTVVGDRIQLQQVVLNLVRNATHAMSNVDNRSRELVIRTEQEEGDYVRLSVKDVGVGFEPQDGDRLFETFYTTKSGGMGIGLSVSRSIIESHHGRLWVTANGGPGVTFAFSIPLRPEIARHSASASPVLKRGVMSADHTPRHL